MNQRDDDCDIYSDLDDKRVGDQCNDIKTCFDHESLISSNNDQGPDLAEELVLFNRYHALENSIKTANEQVCKLTAENDQLKKGCTMKDKQIQVLKRNISSLYLTAKSELDRRAEQLARLQAEYDTLIFRRIHQNQMKENCSSVVCLY